VLICVGGVLPGDSAVDPVVSIVSHGWVDRTVARSDCMFVCGTTSNIDVISPLVGGGGFGSPGLTWIVTVPRQVPVRNDVCPDGPVGVDSRPQLASAEATRIAIACFAGLVIPALLPGPWLRRATVPQ
jgi:hypothetical protein